LSFIIVIVIETEKEETLSFQSIKNEKSNLFQKRNKQNKHAIKTKMKYDILLFSRQIKQSKK
jgi:hypothetical protein